VAADALGRDRSKMQIELMRVELIPTKPPTLWKRWTPTTQPIAGRSAPGDLRRDSEEMEPEERQEVFELLAFEKTPLWPHDHGIHRPAAEATAADAIDRLRTLRRTRKHQYHLPGGSQ